MMKSKKTRAGSGDALVLILLALSTIPVASRAFGQDIPYHRRGAEYSVYSEPVRLSLSAPIVEQVQLALRERGYYSGETDGFIGENTQISIQEFYVDNCYRASPVITRWLLVRLGIGSEGKSAFRARSSRQAEYPPID
jgi:peptidoglycan hydrolase-like protein with peptidoglycan-binding domain